MIQPTDLTPEQRAALGDCLAALLREARRQRAKRLQAGQETKPVHISQVLARMTPIEQEVTTTNERK